MDPLQPVDRDILVAQDDIRLPWIHVEDDTPYFGVDTDKLLGKFDTAGKIRIRNDDRHQCFLQGRGLDQDMPDIAGSPVLVIGPVSVLPEKREDGIRNGIAQLRLHEAVLHIDQFMGAALEEPGDKLMVFEGVPDRLLHLVPEAGRIGKPDHRLDFDIEVGELVEKVLHLLLLVEKLALIA